MAVVQVRLVYPFTKNKNVQYKLATILNGRTGAGK